MHVEALGDGHDDTIDQAQGEVVVGAVKLQRPLQVGRAAPLDGVPAFRQIGPQSMDGPWAALPQHHVVEFG